MTIVCSKCGQIFKSLIISQELAFNEIYTRYLKHAGKTHPDVIAVLAQAVHKVTAALSSYMTISELIMIPESEEWLNEKVEEMQELIMAAAGFDPEEDEEGEDEEVSSDEVTTSESDTEVVDSDETMEACRVNAENQAKLGQQNQ